jgi:predicted RNA-binding protein Jag
LVSSIGNDGQRLQAIQSVAQSWMQSDPISATSWLTLIGHPELAK